jgi:hypothetical protein
LQRRLRHLQVEVKILACLLEVTYLGTLSDSVVKRNRLEGPVPSTLKLQGRVELLVFFFLGQGETRLLSNTI